MTTTTITSDMIHNAIASAQAKIHAANRSRAWILQELINDLRDLVNEPTKIASPKIAEAKITVGGGGAAADLDLATARCAANAARRLSAVRG